MKRLLQAGCVLVALYLFVALVYLPRAIVFGARMPITRSPAELGLEYEDVRLQPADRALALAAWWMEVPGSEVALVFVHGGGSNRHTPYFRALEFYRAAGYPDEQLASLAGYESSARVIGVWGSIVLTLLSVIYMVVLRKWFKQTGQT